jgi:hypothetical protein
MNPTDCVAVGTYVSGSNTLTLVESWNGTTWSVVPSPNPKGHFYVSGLSGVSCWSLTNCAAVGFARARKKPPHSYPQTLVETWNGNAWTIVPSPDPSETGDNLSGVSCSGSPTYCYAAGNSYLSGLVVPLFEDNVPLTITTASLPNGTIGQPYSVTLEASSGNPPYGWSIASGKLPKGLTLNKSTGVISGTPSSKSTFSTFTIEVVDASFGRPKVQNTAEATFTITIDPGP